jgi:hypothetical protein
MAGAITFSPIPWGAADKPTEGGAAARTTPFARINGIERQLLKGKTACRPRATAQGGRQARDRPASVSGHVAADLGEVGFAGASFIDELAVKNHHQAV